jgi:cystathionine beta-synthase
MSPEKIAHAKALGADIRLTRSDVGADHADFYMNLAAKITRETPGAYHINQFGNPANPLAHETTTGPEIWQQMEHDVDAVVVGVGSGGTLTGLSRFFARVQPE